MKSLRIVFAASVLTAAPAMADPIPGLYNTGVDSAGVALTGGNGVTDPHYVVTASTSAGFVGQSAVTFNCCYFADTATSRWVSLSSSGTPGSNTTTYTLTLNLTGYDPTTASLSGRYATDNMGFVSLNGGPLSFASTSFGDYTAFSFSSGFVSGLNTLNFQVTDTGAPTSFRVDALQGSVRAALGGAVPEPSTWAMLVVAFGAVGTTMRVRRRQVRFA